MAHDKDYWESWRGWLIPKLGGIANWLEHVTGDVYYVQSVTHNNQFVGRVPMGEEPFEKELDEMGFERNQLSSWKELKPTGETEEGSWRKVGFVDSPEHQLHVVLYDGSQIQNADTGYTYVYAHWELRWDVAPVKHYRGVGFDSDEGVKKMKNLLNEHGVNHEPVRP
jgi:hypothetical protein